MMSGATTFCPFTERTAIPGNQGVGRGDAELRARAIFRPYHDQIQGELDRRQRTGRASILVAIHSFTPMFMDVARPWHAGVLCNRDARLAEPMFRLLGGESGLKVGYNQPYAASEQSDFTIVHHGERRGIPQVELEIRQDLITDGAGQAAWAQRLARLLVAAAAEAL